MADAPQIGKRPFLKSDPAPETGEGLSVCPGIGLKHTFDPNTPNLRQELVSGWGPVLAVWEGYSADDEIRLSASSGGAATALSLFCLEQEGNGQVVHTAADPSAPYLNKTVMSRSREDLLRATGSRYAPSSPCEGLTDVLDQPTPSVFVGKPCDVAGAYKARKNRPDLDGKIGITIAFFCAGVPSTAGNLELAKRRGAKSSSSIQSLRYRGNGWPGLWSLVYKKDDGKTEKSEMTYAESWGFLQQYRQWRCYICPDHTGEFADIAVGDPWYRPVQPGEPGKSLIVARTQRGLETIKKAAAAGYIVLETEDPDLLPRSQPNLLETRGALWARLITLKLFGAATPVYSGFGLARFWFSELSLIAKIRSFSGTVKRVFKKGLTKRIEPSES
ncbi:coenzyme F420 hydrogenase [Hwanghaeella grinnelliae]|uniref:Coenzyme F420 hydrogenase n=2 Tax=Hwanghaeella grinnelliae TaxID=2500179 RepID=A0A3S2Y0U1_9PROT|nr:coenzyme F420 hydrogenase [Hwanghaeella grinnelliae]